MQRWRDFEPNTSFIWGLVSACPARSENVKRALTLTGNKQPSEVMEHSRKQAATMEAVVAAPLLLVTVQAQAAHCEGVACKRRSATPPPCLPSEMGAAERAEAEPNHREEAQQESGEDGGEQAALVEGGEYGGDGKGAVERLRREAAAAVEMSPSRQEAEAVAAKDDWKGEPASR